VAIVLVLALGLYVGLKPRLARRTAVAGDVVMNTAMPVVNVAMVDFAPSAPTVTLPGSIAALATTPIFARAPGYIGSLFVDIGSRVRRGALLARIDAPELDHQVQQARAIVTQANANLELARVELARWLQMMAADSAVTQEEVDMKRAAFVVAEATLNASLATWRQLVQLQSYEQVRAPFGGVVTARNVDLGALVGTTGAVGGTLLSAQSSATGSLFEVARIDTLRVYVTVPEDNAAGVKVGMAALVTVPALPGDTLRGRVARTSRALDPAARTLLAEVDVANPAGTYLTGSYAEVQLSLTHSASILQLPATALVITDGPPQAITVGSDSTVRFHTITLGRDYGSWVEVISGLESKAMVVLNPPDLLQNGQRVRVMTAAASKSGAGE
jgi:RND family efflux transporter MFP subunit